MNRTAALSLSSLLLIVAGCLHGDPSGGRDQISLLDSKPLDESPIQLVSDERPGWFRRPAWLRKKEEPKPVSTLVEGRESKVAVRKVALDGKAVLLGQDNEPSLTTTRFRQKLYEFAQAERVLSAWEFIRHFPDIAQRTLQDGLTEERPDLPMLSTVARIHDQQTGSVGYPWEMACSELEKDASRFQQYATARRAVQTSLTTGQALPKTRSLPDLLPTDCSPVWAIDAWTITGTLQLLDEKPAKASESLMNALELANGVTPWSAMQIELLLAESLRRDGQIDAAITAWRSSVSRAAKFTTQRQPLIDPTFWAKAAYVHPNQIAWPPAVEEALIAEHSRRGWNSMVAEPEIKLTSGTRQPQAQVASETAECLMWSLIGYAHLDREEPQHALVAFKKCEAICQQPTHAAQWQVQQARALIQLGQSAAATALLMKHSQHAEPVVSLPALAMLGTLKLQANQAKVGLSLLRRSLESFPDATWPGQSEARADLALALLMCGDEARGLQVLHEARTHFERQRDIALLLTSLENEAAYHDARHQADNARQVREQIKTLQASTIQ